MIKKGAIAILTTIISGVLSFLVYAGKLIINNDNRVDKLEIKVESIGDLKDDIKDLRTDMREFRSDLRHYLRNRKK